MRLIMECPSHLPLLSTPYPDGDYILETKVR